MTICSARARTATSAALVGEVKVGETWGELVARAGLVASQWLGLPEADAIAAQFRESWARSDVVITTGGLGPTCDDRTREVIASGYLVVPRRGKYQISAEYNSAAEVLIGDTLCPVAGRLSMDLMIIDATDAPAQALHRNQPVTLIGGPLDIDRVGKTAGTIGYLILTSLSRRYQRRYLGGA